MPFRIIYVGRTFLLLYIEVPHFYKSWKNCLLQLFGLGKVYFFLNVYQFFQYILFYGQKISRLLRAKIQEVGT